MAEVVAEDQVACTAVPWDVAHHGEIYACWQQILRRMPNITTFCFPEWLAPARLSGVEKPWRVLIVRRGEIPLAVIPLKKRTLRTAQIIGEFAYENPPLLIDPAAEEEVWASLAAWIRSRPGVGLVYLGRHSDVKLVERFRQAMQRYGAASHTPRVLSLFTIPLAGSWEDYLGTLGHRTRANIRRLERQFEQEMPQAEFEVITETPAADEALATLIELYRRRWRNEVSGSMLDRADRALCYQEAFHWAIQQGVAAIPVVRMHGKIVASLTLFHLPGQDALQVHLFVRERDVPLPKHFSLGILLCAKTFRWAIENGVRFVGMSYGSTEYKQLLGGRDRERWELMLAPSRIACTFYYRIDSLFDYLSRPLKYLRYLLRRRRRGEQRRGQAYPLNVQDIRKSQPEGESTCDE